jgi:alpha-L-fucosidase
MGRGFGYNQNETEADLIAPDDLVRLLVDVVSKNGNLLLNVGPMSDGTVPQAQVDRLHALGGWLGVNGDAIFKTRPWTRATGTTGDGTEVRFTQSHDGTRTYAIVMGALPAGAVTLVDVGAAASVRLLGVPDPVEATPNGTDLQVALPATIPSQAAYVFELIR